MNMYWMGLAFIAVAVMVVGRIAIRLFLVKIVAKKGQGRKVTISGEGVKIEDLLKSETISRETAKIEDLLKSGKINAEEAADLRKSILGHKSEMPGMGSLPLKPDVHLMAVSCMHLAIGGFLFMVAIFLPFLPFLSFVHLTIIILSHRGGAGFILLAGGCAFIGSLHLVSAIFILKGRRWARRLLTYISIVWCSAFPFGTVLGIYSLWALRFRPGAGNYFIIVKEPFFRKKVTFSFCSKIG